MYTALLPLPVEQESSNIITFAMIKHGMDIQRQITAHLNPQWADSCYSF